MKHPSIMTWIGYPRTCYCAYLSLFLVIMRSHLIRQCQKDPQLAHIYPKEKTEIEA